MDSPWHRLRMIRFSIQWAYEEDFASSGLDAGFYNKTKGRGAGQASCTLRRDPATGHYYNEVLLTPSVFTREADGHYGTFGADGQWYHFQDLKWRAEATGPAHFAIDVAPYADHIGIILFGDFMFPIVRQGEVYDDGKLTAKGPWEDLFQIFTSDSLKIPLPLGPEFEMVLNKGAVSKTKGLSTLTLRCTAVPEDEAVFRVLDDSDQKPLTGVTLLLRHPDGSEVEHVTDDAGEVGLPCCEGEEFVLVKLLPAPEARAPHFAVSWEVRDA